MIELGQCEIVSVFGPMASGKTFLIGQWLKNVNRYVRFDATGETMDDPTVEHIWKSPKALYERLTKPNYEHYFRIAYHPGNDLTEDFQWVVKCLWRLQVDKVLVCDEFHEVCNVNETPRFVQTMMRYARHDKLAVIGASQRIADVHKLFTSGSRKVIIFFSQEERDILAVRNRWGSDAAEMVENLRPLLYDDLSKTTRQVPQCLVISKGSKPQVYDFATGGYVNDVERRTDDTPDESEAGSEAGSGENDRESEGGEAGGIRESSQPSIERTDI